MREVHEKYLQALAVVARCQAKYELSSKTYETARATMDTLRSQLTEKEKEDAYEFSKSLDREQV